MNIHSKSGRKKVKKTELEDLIDNTFAVKGDQQYCETCKKEITGKSKRNFVVLPKTLIVVVDRCNMFGDLLNLVSSFPKELDLSNHLGVQGKKNSVKDLEIRFHQRQQ